MLLSPEGQPDEAWGPSKKETLFRKLKAISLKTHLSFLQQGNGRYFVLRLLPTLR